MVQCSFTGGIHHFPQHRFGFPYSLLFMSKLTGVRLSKMVGGHKFPARSSSYPFGPYTLPEDHISQTQFVAGYITQIDLAQSPFSSRTSNCLVPGCFIIWLWVKTNGIVVHHPFLSILVGIGMLTVGTIWILTHGNFSPASKRCTFSSQSAQVR